MKPKPTLRALLYIASSSLLSISSVHAADSTWNGITGAWSDTTDPGGVWAGGIPADGFDSTANFTGVDIAADQIINLDDAPRTIGNITFTDLTTSSNNLTISGANILTLDRTSGAPLIDVTQSDRSLTISSVIAGNDGLQKNGLGTLTLSGANTYTGTTTISAGTLRLEGTGGGFFSSTSATRNYSISSGAVLNLHNASVPVGIANISGTGTLRISGTGISAGNDLRDVNLNLNVGSVIEIASGSGLYNGGWQCFIWTNNKATLNVNGELNIADGNSVTADALTGAGTIGSSTAGGSTTLTVGNSNGSGTFGGSIIHGLSAGTRVVALTKSGTGTQTLSGNNSYTGTTAISNGILAISHNNALGSTTGNTTISASGASTGPQLRLSNNITSAENITLSGNSDTAQFNSVIYNTSGNNTLSGNITLASPSGGIRLTSSGGELILAGTVSQTGTTRTLNLQALVGASITVNNAIANNNGALNIIGTAYYGGGASNGVTLKGAGTAIGATSVIEKGLLKLGVTDALKTTASLTLGAAYNATQTDSGTFDLAGFNQTVAALIGTKNTSNIGADSTRVVTNSAASTTSLLTVGNGNATGIFNGVILDGAGAVALTKTGSGTQTLVGVNTYSGNTTVNEGTLTLNNANANNETSTVTIAASGALLKLNFAATDTVEKLFIGATQQAIGEYGHTDSGATNGGAGVGTMNAYFAAGTGKLNVTTGPGGGSSEIAIGQGGDIANGGSKSFGTVTTGSNTSLIFTITNSGTAALNLSGSPLVAISGTNAADFTVTATPTTPVTSGGGTTTFTMQFAPGAAGARSAVLTIANNDSDEGTFTINVSGTGQTQYDAWSGGALFDADANGDGVDNGLAFLLGAANPNDSALSLLPTITHSSGNLILTFNMLNSANRGSTSANVQHSSDLGFSDAWTAVTVPDTSGGPTSGVTFVVSPGSPTNGVVATISSSEAASGELFGRIKVTSP